MPLSSGLVFSVHTVIRTEDISRIGVIARDVSWKMEDVAEVNFDVRVMNRLKADSNYSSVNRVRSVPSMF
jgi:hypothetical protein